MGKTKNLNNQASDENMSESQQKTILEKFKNREYNLLVVTSVAAEGVDIPDCNYVVRYDFVSDEISFIQCRGRARCKDSFYHVVTYESMLLFFS
jgi:endoribonuclease Dicer